MKISVFGNPDYRLDSLPIKLAPELAKIFPQIKFRIENPNELGIGNEKNWWIIDAVRGLNDVRLLKTEDLKKIEKTRNSLHDFDLGMHLFWLLKLKKDIDVRIIGIPLEMPFGLALEGAAKIITILLQENGQRSSCRDHKPG